MNEIKKIVRIFRKDNPSTLEEILEAGLRGKDYEYSHHKTSKISLEFVSQGSYRKVYRINGLPLVVKVPNGNDAPYEDCLDHSQNEIDAYENVLKKPELKPLIKYLPEIYYYNFENGIILVKEYKGKIGGAKCKNAMKEIETHFGIELDYWKNFIIEEGTNRVILLDLGLLGSLTEWYETSG